MADWWDAQKMLDMYLLDYLVKRNMHQTAAHFRAESNLPPVEPLIDSKEGFLLEWWTILHDMMTSMEFWSRDAPPPPPPNFNEQAHHQPMTEAEVWQMQLAETAFATNQPRQPQPMMMMQVPEVGSSSISAGVLAAAGQMPMRTNYPLEYARSFNEQQYQLNNVMWTPAGNVLPSPGQTADMPRQLFLPTSQAAAGPSSAPSRYLKQKQPMQNPIMEPLIANNGQGIRIGSSSDMMDNGINGGAALGRGGPEVVSTDAGMSGEMIPMPPEGWLMNFLMDAQKFKPGFLSDKELQGQQIPMPPEGWLMNFLMDAQKFQPGFLSDKKLQGQQKPPGQRRPPAEGTNAAGPSNSVDSIMEDLTE